MRGKHVDMCATPCGASGVTRGVKGKADVPCSCHDLNIP